LHGTIQRSLKSGQACLYELPAPLQVGEHSVSRAIALPISLPGALTTQGVFVVGLNSLLPWDDDYRAFLTVVLGHLGTGLAANAVAILGWDAIYYWNHRFNHESRWLWAMHVVHHSSERYNLSTALRQPVAEGLTMSVPYGLLALAGVRPCVIENARALNLIYQFWIHTEAVKSIGWLENVLNTPSHHRVHHGVNRQYLDRNHGSILILWDRLFGTFEREDERVVYGLTTNIDTFNPVTIATHEWRDVARDVAGASTWRERWWFLLRGPGWAYDRRAEVLGAADAKGPVAA